MILNLKADKFLLIEDRRDKSYIHRISAQINSKCELILLREVILRNLYMVSYRRKFEKIMHFDSNNTLRLYDTVGATSTTSFCRLLKSRFKNKNKAAVFISGLQEFCQQHKIKFDIYFSGQFCLQDYSMIFHKLVSKDKRLCQVRLAVEYGCLTIWKLDFGDGVNNPTDIEKSICEFDLDNTIKLCYAIQKYGSKSLLQEIKKRFANHANFSEFLNNFKKFCVENGIVYSHYG